MDIVFIGEFLRRNHPRLAHEILLHGFPQIDDDHYPIYNVRDDEKYLYEFAGKVARSHGSDLRRSIDVIDIDDRREFKGIHGAYLMGVIRIADYFQIEAERAPGEIYKIRKLLTPLSNLEWKKHLSIIDIKSMPSDPEAFEIKTLPENISEYLALSKLFWDIQRELDLTWSILGEMYGRFDEKLGLHGLSIRRVRSNMDDIRKFSDKVNYVPKEITLKTSNAELIRLMIEPLYGNFPSVGFRELIQNASDACKELKDYLAKNKMISNNHSSEGSTDIFVKMIENESGNWLSVIDSGIGMSIDTIENYYLNVGKSFRNSEEWESYHKNSDGSNEVYRNGKFGVGTLAAFLLGDTVEVMTRHIESDVGYRFFVDIKGEAIEINKFLMSVGTEIRVRVSNEMLEILKYYLFGSKHEQIHTGSTQSWLWYRGADLNLFLEELDGSISSLAL